MSYNQSPYGEQQQYQQQQQGGDFNNPQDRGLIGTLVVGGALAYGASQLMNKPTQAPGQGQGQGQGQTPPSQQNHQVQPSSQPPQYGQQQQQQQQQQHGYGGVALGAATVGGAGLAYGAYSLHKQHQQPHTFGTSAATDVNLILAILQKTVQDQKITAFYPPNSLPPIAQRIASSGAISKIVQEWRLPLEIAMDLSKIALFDVWLYLDDSGSIQYDEKGERLIELKKVAGQVAFVAGLLDSDGVNIRFMNSRIEGNNIASVQAVNDLIRQVKFTGMTPLGTALEEKILKPQVLKPAKHGSLRKPVLACCITDGEPNGESRSKLASVISRTNAELKQTQYGPDAISYQLAQVGNDLKARAFLEEIDTNKEIGGLVDVTSNYSNEGDNLRKHGVTLTPELWISKLLLGAIDSAYDSTDEGGSQAYANKLNYATGNPNSYRAYGLPSQAPPPDPSYSGSAAPPAYGAPTPAAGGYGYQSPPPQGQYPSPQQQQPQYGYGQQRGDGPNSSQQAPYYPQSTGAPPQQGYSATSTSGPPSSTPYGYPSQAPAVPHQYGAPPPNAYGGPPPTQQQGYPSPPFSPGQPGGFAAQPGGFYAPQQQNPYGPPATAQMPGAPGYGAPPPQNQYGYDQPDGQAGYRY